jgi:hypothetical protein
MSLSSWLVLPGWSFNYKEARKLSAMKWRESYHRCSHNEEKARAAAVLSLSSSSGRYADELIIRLIHNHNVNRHNDSTGRREGKVTSNRREKEEYCPAVDSLKRTGQL